MRLLSGARTWLGLGSVAMLLALVLGVACSRPVPTQAEPASAEPATKGGTDDWPMFGRTPQRNLVNPIDKNIPGDWSLKKGQEKNIKWVARLGTMAYGGPVIAGGKVFIGTNNEKPRDPAITGDKGILMCFRESDGQFLAGRPR